MSKLHDPELELFKRTINLVQYATKAGYELRPRDGAPGLTVLEHPNRDRIVVAQDPTGPWIYASVPDYALRAAGEPTAHALSRLRHCIDRAKDKGSIVEFVQERDPRARGNEVPPERVRERLREFRATGLPLDFEGPLRPPPSAIDRNHELNQRRYDWSPPVPNAPRETNVDERLRRRREAQAAIDLKVGGSREAAPARPAPPSAATPAAHDPKGPPSLPDRPPIDRSPTPPLKKNTELNRRRYDWTPEPPGLEAIRAMTRGPSKGRDR